MEENLAQRASTIIKFVCFGPESTGKTTLAKALATHYKTSWAPEFMRTYFEEKWRGQKGISEPQDILPVAQGQMASENKLTENANRYLFCDTDLLQIKVYSEIYFNGYCPPIVKKYALQNTYCLYFLMAIDIPWEEDNLRDKPEAREVLFTRFENELIQQHRPYIVLQGDYETRLSTAIKHIQKINTYGSF